MIRGSKLFVFFRHDHAFCAGHLHAVVADRLCPGLHEQRRAGRDHRRTAHAAHGLQHTRRAQDLPARTGQILRDCWETEVHKKYTVSLATWKVVLFAKC